MATIQIQYTWADGSMMGVVVSGKGRYPQHLSDLRAESIRAWREAMGVLGIEVVAEVPALVEPDEQAAVPPPTSD